MLREDKGNGKKIREPGPVIGITDVQCPIRENHIMFKSCRGQRDEP